VPTRWRELGIEEPVPVLEAHRELCGVELSEPGSRDLEGERESLELTTDGHQRACVAGVERELRAYDAGAGEQHRHRRYGGQLIELVGGGATPGHRERRHGVLTLDGDADPLLRRGQHLHPP